MNKENEIKELKDVVDKWLTSLDSDDLQSMLDTCDPEVIIANENTPTTVGIKYVTEKYAPRMDAAIFKSGFEYEHVAVYDDLAIIIGEFTVETTNKKTSEVAGGSGRLALIYRRHVDGSWKLILDMDNNG